MWGYLTHRVTWFIDHVITWYAKIALNLEKILEMSPIKDGFLATISHINYWDQVNSWENFQKFWNGPLSRSKSGPSPLINVAASWKSSNTKACAKKLSQMLANNNDNGGRGIGLRLHVRYCSYSKQNFW